MQIDAKSTFAPPLIPNAERQVGLLVSVRSTAEALIAWEAGAQVIDIKEPNNGALGASSPEVWHHVCHALPPEVPVTLALGEAVEVDPSLLSEIPARVTAIKFGPAHCSHLKEYLALLDRFREITGKPCVRVAYADHVRAQAPPLADYLSNLRKPHAVPPWLLIDTYCKDQFGFMHWISEAMRHELIANSRTFGYHNVFAGQLTEEDIERLTDAPPHLIAVRGAACHTNRQSGIARERVVKLVKKIGDIWHIRN